MSVGGDIGFADICNYPPVRYSAIAILRLPAKATSATILTVLQSFLAQTEIVGQLKSKLAIIELGRVRMRKG
jgi:hypothetical protein